MATNDNTWRFRMIFVKINDLITDNQLITLKWMFRDEIRRMGEGDISTKGAFEFFQQLLERDIINMENLLRLIDALDKVGCGPAAQILRGIIILYLDL